MKKFILAFLFCIIAPFAFGDIILETSNSSPSMDEPFVLQVKFLNEDKQDYNIDGIDKFQIISRGSQSNYSMVNGKTTSSKSDVYNLLPLEKGKVELVAKGDNGKTSNKITLDVREAGAPSTAPKNSSVAFQSNLKNKTTYYFGEKIPFYENFLSAVQVGSIGYVSRPQFESFSVKDMTPVSSNGQYITRYFNDKNGNTIAQVTMYQGVLMPDSSGEKKITLGKVGYTQILNDDFIFSRTSQPRYLGGGTVDITILPLPQERPVGFQNVVGTPTIDYNWNKDKVSYGDSVVLNITISGSVNLDTLDKIFTQNIEDFNIFENVKGFNEDIKDGRYEAVKNFEVAFIPKKTGKLITPEVKIPYFNTKDKKFEELIIPSKEISVEGSVTGTAPMTPGSAGAIGGNQNTANLNTGSVNNTPAMEEIKIDTISDKKSTDNINIIIGLIVLAVVEGGVIVYLLVRKDKKGEKYDLSSMANAKDNKEFYEAYCNFMKAKFKFSPKVHLDDRLVRLGFTEEFININREIEDAYFSNLPIDRKNMVKRIKKELKNVR